MFLNGLPVKEFESEQPIPERLFLVFILHSANRQNNVDMMCNFLVEAKEHLLSKGECD